MTDPRQKRIEQVKQELERYSVLASLAGAQGVSLSESEQNTYLALAQELRQLESADAAKPG